MKKFKSSWQIGLQKKTQPTYYTFVIENNSRKKIRVGVTDNNKLVYTDIGGLSSAVNMFGSKVGQINEPRVIIQFFNEDGTLGNQYKLKMCNVPRKPFKEHIIEFWNIIVGDNNYGDEAFSPTGTDTSTLCEVSKPITNNNNIWSHYNAWSLIYGINPFPTIDIPLHFM